jgi:hypothetical protein
MVGYLDDTVDTGHGGVQGYTKVGQWYVVLLTIFSLLWLCFHSSTLRVARDIPSLLSSLRLSFVISSTSGSPSTSLSIKVMSDDSFKASLPAMADEKCLSHAHTRTDDGVGEIHDLTQLGYKPELTRNRSMLTLLFQCLAMAAVRKYMHYCYAALKTLILLSQRMEKAVHL